MTYLFRNLFNTTSYKQYNDNKRHELEIRCHERLGRLYDDIFDYLEKENATDADALKIIQEYNYLFDNCAHKIDHESFAKVKNLYLSQSKNKQT